ncbi:MAG: TonB-dependent receptor [Croceibacterium sp.]
MALDRIRLLRVGASAAALGAASLFPGGAWAQGAAPAAPVAPATVVSPTPADQVPADTKVPDEQASGDAIIVTGSRIARSGFTAPTPVTVLDSARTQELAISNVADALNQLPSFRASAGPANAQNFGGNVGARILDLRALGAPRTLILVDGRRFMPSTSEGTVDINLIPSILVQRTEVVTGGASAVYGSDAVAGVVNFILDRKLNGLKAEMQFGLSQRRDDGNRYFGAVWGTPLGDRGHFTIAGEYEANEGLAGCYEARAFCAQERSIVGNSPPGTGGQPANIITSDVHNSTLFPGGLINRSFNAAGAPIGTSATDPLRGTKFLSDGTPAAFQYGQFAGALFQIGGDGHGTNAFLSSILLKVPVERYSTYASFDYDLTDSIKAFADLSYGHVKGTVLSSTFRDFNGSIMGNIKIDNPYIPASVRTRALAAGVASFTLGRSAFDFGSPKAVSTDATYRGVIGLRGQFGGGWTWDAYYQHGKNEFYQTVTNDVINANLRKAVDAVQVGNTIVCRVNADAITTNDDPACRPINLFGEGRFSAEALDYVIGEGFQKTTSTQDVAAVNVGGDLFSITDRPVSISVGAEYRKNKIKGTTDPISAGLGFFVINGQAVTGSQEVKEAYGELLVPLLNHRPFFENLELSGAVRYTDYSTSGSVVTWKVGGVYEPITGIRFRATRSRDIRAPNVSELFGPQQKSTTGLNDPIKGQSNPIVIRGSNPALLPEKADSFTAGVVLAPVGGFLSHLRLSADYFNIKVNQAIGVLGAQTLVDRCFAGATEFCPLVFRDASQNVIQVNDVLVNANSVKTKGVEVELAYRQPLAERTELNLRLLGTYTADLITVDTAGATERAGQTGSRAGNVLGVPDYTIDGVASLTHQDTTLTFHGRYIPKGLFNVAFIGPDNPKYAITLANTVTDNTVPSRFYLDFAFTQKFAVGSGREAELFGAVNNLFDTDPPALPSGNLGTNQVLFDPVGRAFKIGARVRFGG